MPHETKSKSEKPRRTSVGSGKTRGAVSLAYVDLKTLLKIVRSEAKIPIGRVFGESLGLRTRRRGKVTVLVESH